jgi:hypothetical protein
MDERETEYFCSLHTEDGKTCGHRDYKRNCDLEVQKGHVRSSCTYRMMASMIPVLKEVKPKEDDPDFNVLPPAPAPSTIKKEEEQF